MKAGVWVVYSDDCNENDCGCYSESVDSIWLDETKAKKRASERYHGHAKFEEISE